ncbi:MAG TPA: alkaline phosphatase family protein [Thermoanaerobaculia bacterium]|nr:alkaline phosphatase family protein [Thermoanaerobaculia bacterium]
MSSRSLPILFTAFVLSCAPAATSPQHVEPPRPRFAATAVARRVVLLSFDGLGADALARQKNLPAFERLAREGASARIINVNPTLTAPTHVSILTGADPQRTGIVSNRFHLPGTPVEQEARGLMVDPDVETLVEAARRQGKRVGAVSFPTIDNRSPRRTADFGMAWGMPMVPARLVELTRDDFRREWVPPTWTERPQRRRSFSPIMRARVEWSVPRVTRADVDVVAYDTTDDRTTNYDTYFVETGEREFDVRDWFAISSRTTSGLHGSWSKVLRTTPSLGVTIYWGAISRNQAWPESFLDLLDEQVGFWPGAPEEGLEVEPAIFIDQLQRLAAHYTRAQTLAIERMPFDLLLAYQPQIDQASHQYLGTPDADRVIGTAFAAADRGLAAIGEALDPEDALIVTSDHGLIAIEREVLMNRLLAEKGFAPRWRAFSSGAIAHLYRFSGPDDSNAVVDMLTATGHFEKLEKKSTTSHRNSGDIIATAYPGIALSSADEPEQPHGHHGALNTHRELHPVLFAYGTGVTPGPLGEISQTRIARYVAGLLGITPPAAAE